MKRVFAHPGSKNIIGSGNRSNIVHEMIGDSAVRWSPFDGQIGGLAKLVSGLRHAAISIPAEAK